MDILISGTGIAGLTLARCLERRGHRPVVLERSSTVRHGGYMIDFLGPGYDAAQAARLLPALEACNVRDCVRA